MNRTQTHHHLSLHHRKFAHARFILSFRIVKTKARVSTYVTEMHEAIASISEDGLKSFVIARVLLQYHIFLGCLIFLADMYLHV